MLKNSTSEYGSMAKILHWVMAAIILGLIGVGIYMADLSRETVSQKKYAFQFYDLHKSFGVIALVLILLRLVWLRISPAPALPAAFASGERKFVKALQGLLYLLMLVLPISGYMMSNAGGHPIMLFGLFEMPAIFGESETLGGISHAVHQYGGWFMLLVILLHIAGALKHRILDKGGERDILSRML